MVNLGDLEVHLNSQREPEEGLKPKKSSAEKAPDIVIEREQVQESRSASPNTPANQDLRAPYLWAFVLYTP